MSNSKHPNGRFKINSREQWLASGRVRRATRLVLKSQRWALRASPRLQWGRYMGRLFCCQHAFSAKRHFFDSPDQYPRIPGPLPRTFPSLAAFPRHFQSVEHYALYIGRVHRRQTPLLDMGGDAVHPFSSPCRLIDQIGPGSKVERSPTQSPCRPSQGDGIRRFTGTDGEVLGRRLASGTRNLFCMVGRDRSHGRDVIHAHGRRAPGVV